MAFQKNAKHEINLQIVQDEQEKREGGGVFQHKVSYATLRLVQLQVSNHCILISVLEEEGRKKEENSTTKDEERETKLKKQKQKQISR